jgi:beta-galactosidase
VAVNDDNEQGVSDAVDVIGFNYMHWFHDGFHKRHPKRPIIGSETSSAVSTRGEYETVAWRNVMSSYDGKVSWGTTPEEWWKFYAEREWLAGGFAWTGFDYRGEPTPYGWPSISSQFGITDACGFPKDYYHYYRAWWSNKPALHLFPHWNWGGREGKPVEVWVYSSADEVELLLNGKSLGRQAMPRLGHLSWKVNYEPGAIEARAYRGGQLMLTERRETTGGGAALRLTADRTTLAADGEDVAVIRAEMLDDQGRWLPTVNDKLVFRVRGAGRLIGVGNGDPNSHESDQGNSRSLYNGLAQLIVRANRQAGDIVVEATVGSQVAGVKPARLVINAKPAQRRPAVG